MSISTLLPTPSEAMEIIAIADELFVNSNEWDAILVLENAKRASNLFPTRIREFFLEFSEKESSDALIIKLGEFLSNKDIPTPIPYPEECANYKLNRYQVIHTVFSSLLGTPIGWSTQRKGSVINNIIPNASLASIPNSSSGVNYDFGFHTEDAFHEYKGDYLGLVCIRNNEEAVTRFFSVKNLSLSNEDIAILSEEKFIIKNNPIHETEEFAFSPQSVLYGNKKNPFMRVNFANMHGIDTISESALNRLKKSSEVIAESVILRSGDFFYLDNFYTAHARDAYSTQFNNESRWLSRYIITKDLRKSAKLRTLESPYVIQVC
ncbi:MAG: hypothetical protein RL641_629 [Candidatus Parcubacteria bacterium]|jgi:hypothetical protein